MSPRYALVLEEVTLETAEGGSVFAQLNWGAETGSRHVVHGSAGRGCTALLRLCAGLAHPGRGQVILDGTPLGPYTFDHPFLKRGGLGWVPTEGGLIVNMTLLANVALPLRFVRGLGREEAEARALAGLEAAGLGPMAGLRPHAVESRDRWLTALVRTSLMEPELWLVDRPNGTLPPARAALARELLSAGLADPLRTLLAVEGPWIPDCGARELTIAEGRLALEETP